VRGRCREGCSPTIYKGTRKRPAAWPHHIPAAWIDPYQATPSPPKKDCLGPEGRRQARLQSTKPPPGLVGNAPWPGHARHPEGRCPGRPSVKEVGLGEFGRLKIAISFQGQIPDKELLPVPGAGSADPGALILCTARDHTHTGQSLPDIGQRGECCSLVTSIAWTPELPGQTDASMHCKQQHASGSNQRC